MKDQNLEQEFSLYRELINLSEDDMVTSAEISTATLAVTKTIDVLKRCKELADKCNDLEIKEVIVDLRSALVDTKSTLIDAKEEINFQKQKISELNQELLNRENLSFDPVNKVYYRKNDSVPICPTCYESKDKSVIHLHKVSAHKFEIDGNFQCKSCGNDFLISESS